MGKKKNAKACTVDDVSNCFVTFSQAHSDICLIIIFISIVSFTAFRRFTIISFFLLKPILLQLLRPRTWNFLFKCGTVSELKLNQINVYLNYSIRVAYKYLLNRKTSVRRRDPAGYTCQILGKLPPINLSYRLRHYNVLYRIFRKQAINYNTHGPYENPLCCVVMLNNFLVSQLQNFVGYN